MSSLKSKMLQVILVLSLSVFLAFPIQGYDMFQNMDEIRIDIDEELTLDGSRILTEEEVMELGLGDVPTRSLPEKEWERFGYHRGGESGAATYNSSSQRLYLYGGGSESSGWGGVRHSAYDDMFYYDLSTEKWVALEYDHSDSEIDDPGARYRMSYATDDTRKKMYMYGGFYGESQASMVNDLWEFDMGTEMWTRLVSSGPLPDEEKRVEAPMVIDPTQGEKGMLYIHMGRGGGTERNNLTRFYQIDLANPGSVSSLPAGESDGMERRYGHEMAIDTANDMIYIFGGIHKVDDDNRDYLREMWAYDMNNPGWTEITLPDDMPLMQGAKMFVARNGTINIWGGRGSGTDENETLWIYDPEQELWSWVHYPDPDTNEETPQGRGYYARYYSRTDEKFFVFAGRYWSGNSQGRYRDINYLDTRTYSLEWTQFEDNQTATSRDGGIFAYNSNLNRLYYIGPTEVGGWWGNGTEYIWYFDLNIRDWVGPFYNTGASGPEDTIRAGVAYIEEENTVYVYGGGYTTGSGQNTRYWTRGDFWKVDLDTFEWTLIYEEAFPGELQGIELLYNPDTKLLYFYGGYSIIDPDDRNSYLISPDFYSFDPSNDQFKKINQPSVNPEGRFGSSLVYDYDDKVMYLFGGEHQAGGSPNSQPDNDLWRYDFSANTWTEIDATYKPSPRYYSKLVYDPLTKELYLLGGYDGYDDFVTYRILEQQWNSEWYPTPNPGALSGHAVYFNPDTRDIWLFGGRAKSGVWRMGIPARLAIQNVEFTNAEDDNTLAYAMLKTYDFQVVTKTVNGPEDLDEMRFELPHANGKLTLIYKRSEDYPGGNPWTEYDNGDYAELTADPTVTVDGNLISFDIPLKFHWNWTHKAPLIDRIANVRCTGIGVEDDTLKVTRFLSVRNRLELTGGIEMIGEYQGTIANNSWIRSDEEITIHGPVVSYVGTNVNPPVDTYEVRLWDENDDFHASSAPAGDEINITILSPNTTKTGYTYILNITGVPENTDTTEIELILNVDGNSPEAPGLLTIHADKADDTRTEFDNDLDIFATWQSSFETGSGTLAYYWAFSDLGGTRLGTELNVTTNAEIHLPTNGSHTLYVWAEDKVGNIGPASNASILIDDEPIIFDLLSPDLGITIPYDSIEIELNITDLGGSLINSYSVYYRYTSAGLNDEANWQGPDAWKYFQDIWDLEDSSNFLVEMELKDLSQGSDNFFQFRAVDGAGSDYESEVFSLEVDFDLAYPKVTMLGPQNYAEFSDADDVILSWNVEFFEPNDVVYFIYMSTNKDWVVNLDPRALWKELPVDMEYQPTGLTFGTYYWTVIPVARGEYTGESLTGYYSFNLTNEESYTFDVNPDETVLRFRQGTVGIPMNFDMTNKGNFDAYIKPTLVTEGVVNITWEGLPDNGYMVRIGSTYTAIAMMTVPSNATVGNFTLQFQFESDMGIIRTTEISLQITQRAADKPPVDDDPDLSLFIVLAIILVIVILAIIAALYFLVFKKKEKKDEITLEHELDELEKEYGLATGVSMAPQPKGGATKAGPAKTPRPPVEGEEDLDEFQDVEEEPILAEPGSEDDWMNIVASETVALESQSAVEEDKLAETDGQPKELSDILGEMMGK